MSFFKWSKTANNNATADPSINWAEGQAPSTVNDSARALMAAAAKYRDDVAGIIITGGTSSAYTLTSNQQFDSLANMDGKVIGFVPHVTNAAGVTLNVDGLGAKAITVTNAVGLEAGVLIAGTPYVAVYNNAQAQWRLFGLSPSEYDTRSPAAFLTLAPRRRTASSPFPLARRSRARPMPACSVSSARLTALATARPRSTCPTCAGVRCSARTTWVAQPPTASRRAAPASAGRCWVRWAACRT
jgi:hypothetical protein